MQSRHIRGVDLWAATEFALFGQRLQLPSDVCGILSRSTTSQSGRKKTKRKYKADLFDGPLWTWMIELAVNTQAQYMTLMLTTVQNYTLVL